MDTKAGRIASNSRTARHSRASASASRGGENSTENGIGPAPSAARSRDTIDGVRDTQPALARPRMGSVASGYGEANVTGPA